MHIINDLTGKIESAKSLNFGNIFSSSIDTFKKVWLQGLVTYLLGMVLALPFLFVVYIPMIFLGLISPETFEGDIDLNGVSAFAIGLAILLFVFLLIGMAAISLGLKAAFFRIVKSKELGLNQPDDYFFFFKKQYLKKTIGLGLSMLGMFLLAYVLCVLPLLYLIVPLYYMTIIYALNPDMPNSDIIRAGFQLGNKKWFLSFGLLFVAAIFSGIVGILLCFIGIYITQQFVDLPCYHIYKEVIGLNETNPIDEIGANFE